MYLMTWDVNKRDPAFKFKLDHCESCGVHHITTAGTAWAHVCPAKPVHRAIRQRAHRAVCSGCDWRIERKPFVSSKDMRREFASAHT